MSLWSRITNVFHADRLSGEIDEELQSHIADAIEEGRDPAEARRAFGPALLRREESLDARLVTWLDSLVRDFRHGFASLARNPGFAVAAVGVLALGIGANTAMFSVVDAVVLKPLPFPEPERLVTLNEAENAATRYGASALNFVDWKRLGTSLEALAAASPTSDAVMIGGEPERWVGQRVSADYFKVFGTKAQIGRTFAPGEDQAGAVRVVVLSHAVWKQRFGGASDILDRDLLLSGQAHRIIGVLPAGCFDRDESVFWKPLVFGPAELTRESMWLSVVGRLRAGVSPEQAQEEMRQVAANLANVNPPWKKGWSVILDPFGRNIGARLRQSIFVAFGAVVMVLLIACSNVANLLLARGAARQKEIAVRTALGASRGRLIGQLLTESLAVCLLGGAAGVAFAYLLLRAVLPATSLTLPPTAEVRLDLRVFAFAGFVVVGVSLLIGLLPALRISSGGLSASMNQAARGSSVARATLRRVIVAGEVAVSLVLVCGAMLMFRSLLNLQNVDAGVRIANVIGARVELPLSEYPTAESAVQFAQAAVERIQTSPGVEQAAVASDVPLERVNETDVILTPRFDRRFNVNLKHVDENYFSTLGIPVLSGRGITGRDRKGAPRVIVANQELARLLSAALGAADPVGKVVHLSVGAYAKTVAELADVEVIGVIRSERAGSLQEPDGPVAYASFAQQPVPWITLITHVHGDVSAAMRGLRESVRQIDPHLPLGAMRTMEEVKERSFTGTTQSTWAIGAFAGVAAVLAAFGLYSVLAQTVTQQRREIGIRVALGASSGEIVAGVVRNAAAMVAVGLAIGLAGASAATGLMKSLLFQVSPLDPIVFAIACGSMMLVALMAVSLPAHRAAHVDPVTTLRDEG